MTGTIDPHDFLSFERRIDYSVISPGPDARRCTHGLARSPLRLHQRLGLPRRAGARAPRPDACFDGIFDILAGDLIPKPYPESLDAFLKLFGMEPTRAAMFDDLAVNLELPRARG